jgi:hypothetical protein
MSKIFFVATASVANPDPTYFDAYPSPFLCGSGSSFLFDADPDPTFHSDADPVADPDPSFQIKGSNP